MPANDFKHKNRVKYISYKLGISKDAVETILNLQSDYIKKKIAKVELNNSVLLTEEEFNEKLPVFRIHPIGYLKPDYRKYKHINKNNKNIKTN